jgi:hypothetical protein
MKPSYVSHLLSYIPLCALSHRWPCCRALLPCCSNERTSCTHSNCLNSASISKLCVLCFFFLLLFCHYSFGSFLTSVCFRTRQFGPGFLACSCSAARADFRSVARLGDCTAECTSPPVRTNLKSAQGRQAVFARSGFLPCSLLSSPRISFVVLFVDFSSVTPSMPREPWRSSEERRASQDRVPTHVSSDTC